MASSGDFSCSDCIRTIRTLSLEELDAFTMLGPWEAVLPARWSRTKKVTMLWQYIDVCDSRIIAYASGSTNGLEHRDLVPIRGNGACEPPQNGPDDPMRRELEIIEPTGDRDSCLDSKLMRIWTEWGVEFFLGKRRALELVRRRISCLGPAARSARCLSLARATTAAIANVKVLARPSHWIEWWPRQASPSLRLLRP